MSESKNPNEVAAGIQQENHLMFLEGRFYRYDGGVYKSVSDILIRKTIKGKLGTGSRMKQLDEVYEALSLDCHKTHEGLSELDEYVNVKNGMLKLETLTLLKHSPKYCSVSQFPINFRRKATCHLFLKTIADWLDGNQQSAQLVQEFLGYCLTANTAQEKMLFLLGDGANGKSTLLRVIRAVFGDENCSSIGLDQLSEKYGAAGLRGKLINLSSESPSKAVLGDDVIKRIVSGEPFQIEEKYKPPFDFTPSAKLIVACNSMPRTDDKSQAIFRRLLILSFNKTYSDQKRDMRLAEKLAAEKDGIFLWCVEGLLRLKKRGYFDEPKDSVLTREEYQKENNSIILFVEERCILDNQLTELKANLYKEYGEYCKVSGLLPFSKPKFGKELKRFYKLGEQFGDDFWGSRARLWTGIKVHDD